MSFSSADTEKQPSQNMSFAYQFVVRGASKRRKLAYEKARDLQRELGVIPRLVSVK